MKRLTVHIWSKWWVWGWSAALFLTWMTLFSLMWWYYVPLMAVVFLGPELYAIKRQPSSYPPLTVILRRYVPAWATFPMLGFAVVLPVAWYTTYRPIVSGIWAGAAALLLWIADHFDSTYDRRTPR